MFSEVTITEALKLSCGLCKAKPGQLCVNVLTDQPLHDRRIHHYRIEPS